MSLETYEEFTKNLKSFKDTCTIISLNVEGDDESNSDLVDRASKKLEKIAAKKNNKRVASSTQKISYTVQEKDSIEVKKLKEIINKSNITLQDLYDRFPDENLKAYNLYRNLSINFNVQQNTLREWLDILGYELQITFKKK